jgi:diguanylate cyclase (GGDEF)-like protein
MAEAPAAPASLEEVAEITPVFLIIEDNDDLRNGWVKRFKHEGYVAHGAKDAKGARKRAGELNGPAIAIMDWELKDSDVNGAELLPEMIEIARPHPIAAIFVSGRDDLERERKALAIKGVVGYYTKPVTFARLAARILPAKQALQAELDKRALEAEAKRLLEEAHMAEEEQRRLARLATHDHLTGLFNHEGFFAMGRQIVREVRRDQKPLTGVFFDANKFKRINDEIGHDFGDSVIKACGECFHALVRDTDLVGRWMGDEFHLLCRNTTEDQGKVLAAKIVDALHSLDLVDLLGNPLNLRFSVGVATLAPEQLGPDDDETLKRLIKESEIEMYKDKGQTEAHRSVPNTGGE